MFLLGLTFLLIGSTTALTINEPTESYFQDEVNIVADISSETEDYVTLYHRPPSSDSFTEVTNMTGDSEEVSYSYSKSDDASGTHGSYDFQVIAYDTDNSELGSDTIDNIVMDTQSPEISSESPTGVVGDDNPDIEASFSDSVSGLANASISFEGEEANGTGSNAESLSIDGGDYSNLNDGDHSVVYEAFDEAGNSISSSWSFTVDTVYEGPTEFSFSPSPGIIDVAEDDREIDFTLENENNDATDLDVLCIVNGNEEDSVTIRTSDGEGDTFTCDIPSSYDAQYFELELELRDQAGNFEVSESQEYGFDALTPSIDAIESVQGVNVFNDNFELEYAASDDVAGVDIVEYYVGSDPGIGEATQYSGESGAFEVDTSDLEAGSHEVHIRAKDQLGKWGNTDSFSFDYYPDEVPELQIDVTDEVEVTSGEIKTVDVELSNTGRLLVSAGELQPSEIAESATYGDLGPEDTETVGLVFSPEDALGEYTIQIEASTADASAQLFLTVTADPETQEDIDSETSSYSGDYQELSEKVESLRSGLSQERAERLDSDFSEFEASVRDLEEAVENEDYYRADQILENIDSQMQSAQQTFEEVEEEQRIADRNRMIIFAFVLLFAILGGGAGFLAYSEDYDLKMPEADQFTGFRESGSENEPSYGSEEEDDEDEEGLVDKIKSKIDDLKNSDNEGSDEPEYEFK